jgi:hypothetical protein
MTAPTMGQVIAALRAAGIPVESSEGETGTVTRRRDGSQVVLTMESEGVRLSWYHGPAASGDRKARTWEPTVGEVVARVGAWHGR